MRRPTPAGWPPPGGGWPLEVWIALGVLALAIEDLVLAAEHIGILHLPR